MPKKQQKELYLHIGCGKTGSSALQLWLHRNHSVLKRHGIYYPEANDGVAYGEYQITSGNGSILIDKLDNKSHERYLEALFQKHSTLLFSSEQFQGIENEALADLASAALKLDFRPVIIVYVRDVYDVIYSLYVQRVKRHLETRTFEEFALKLTKLQQFQVLRRYEKYFDDLRVIHYDTERDRGIDRAFADILGLGDEIPRMALRKVNRSLTVFEWEMLRQINRIYIERFDGTDTGFSWEVSDRLIYDNPEAETEIFFKPELFQELRRKFLRPIARVNRTYFPDKRLRFFRKKEKKLVRKVPKISEEYLTALEASMNYAQRGISPGKSVALRTWERLCALGRNLR